MNEVLVVMIHLFENIPDPELDQPNVRWKQASDRLIDKIKSVEWPIVYQLDFIKQSCYNELVNHRTKTVAKIFGNRWSLFHQFGNNLANKNISLRDFDYLSTSNDETSMIIANYDPKIVLFGGLHKDRCVTGVMTEIQTVDREYHISNNLAYSWRQTWENG